jgi:hypothetical protein
MNNIKTYEGFLDVFKKSKKPDDIRKALTKDLEEKFSSHYDVNGNWDGRYHFNLKQSTDNKFILEYRLDISKFGPRHDCILLQDVFTISLEKGKKMTCTIKISREHNYDHGMPIIKKFNREVIQSEEKIININPVEKLPEIINQIQSETSKLYTKIKSDTKKVADELSDNIKNVEKKEEEMKKDILAKELKFKEDREKYKENLLKDFDIDNVRDLVLDLKDEFNDVLTDVFDLEDKIYFQIRVSGLIDSDDKYNLGIKARTICNDFIKRYKSEYGDEYNIKVDFNPNEFYIDFELGEYPNELKKPFGLRRRTNTARLPGQITNDFGARGQINQPRMDNDVIPLETLPLGLRDDDSDILPNDDNNTDDNYDLDNDNNTD